MPIGTNREWSVFGIAGHKKPLKPGELLEAIHYWQRYPQFFGDYAFFASGPARDAEKISVVSTNREGKTTTIPLKFSPQESADCTIEMFPHFAPTRLVQFHGFASKAVFDRFRKGYRLFRFEICREGKTGLAHHLARLAVVNMPGHELYGEAMFSITRFNLPMFFSELTRAIALELTRRKIDSRPFLKSADVCMVVCNDMQRYWSNNRGLWPNVIKQSSFARDYSRDWQHVYQAEIDIESVEQALSIELEAQRSRLRTDNRVEENVSAKHDYAIDFQRNDEPRIATTENGLRVDKKWFAFKGSAKTVDRLVAFFDEMISTRDYVSMTQFELRTRNIYSQCDEVQSVLDVQPATGTRIKPIWFD